MKLFLIVFSSVALLNLFIVVLAKKYLDRATLQRIPIRSAFFLIAMLSSASLVYSALFIEYTVPVQSRLPVDTLSMYEPLSQVILQEKRSAPNRPVPRDLPPAKSLDNVPLNLDNVIVSNDPTDLGDLGDVFGDPTQEGISDDWKTIGIQANVDAQFPGGYDEFAGFVKNNFYLDPRLRNDSKVVLVFVSFKIDKQGKVHDIEILRGESEMIDREVLRVLEMSPSWEPAIKDGERVEVYKRLPIRIKLYD